MYTAFYKLKEEPFHLTPDPRFLHLAQPHRAALEAVVQSVLRRKGFAVITGPIGTGKTTLLHAAMQMLFRLTTNQPPLASAFILNPMLNRDEFLETLLGEFEVPCSSTSKPARLAALHKMFLERQRLGGTSVLIIDEAHMLTVELLEEVRLLSNADTYQEKLCQIILCGQPELIPVLKRKELRALQQRIGQYCSLRQLTLPETRGYIVERLHSAGLQGNSPFCSKAIELVHLYSQGVPRVINQICDSALAFGFTSQCREITPAIIEEVATGLHLTGATENEPEKTPTEEVESAVAKTMVDFLIDAMKQRRATALE